MSPGFEEPEAKKGNKPMHVLLVEDNIVNQQVLRKQLTRAGCVVYTADHGVDALKQLKGTNCYRERKTDGIRLDVILMDTQMPMMGGIECTTEIRRLEADGTIYRHVPIIAVTANARKEQRDELMAIGSDTVVSKPFKSADLLLLMKEYVFKHEEKLYGFFSPAATETLAISDHANR